MVDKMVWTGPDVLAATEGEPICGTGDFVFSGVSIDSRTITPSQLFVAVRGERHDGHDYINEVQKKGVAGFVFDKARRPVVTETLDAADNLGVAVDDTVRALGGLGRYQRRRSGLIVAAITGTNGKTSTKEMTARILEQQYRVLATAGNNNNEIGVPLTLLRLEATHQVGVLELGMNAPGEIARLTGICEPDIGVVLNVGEGHLAGLGNIDNVARAKGELIEMMDEKGAAVLNADDPRVLKMAEMACGRVMTFGQTDRADVRAINVRQTAAGSAFDIRFADLEAVLPVRLNAGGLHLVHNALAAAAVGRLMDVAPAAIARGLANFAPVSGRMTVISTRTGYTVVDDTYNANPGSMRAAIATVTALAGQNRRLLVLGDMFELGAQAADLHEAVGRWAAESGTDLLFAVGEFAENVAAGAIGAGMAKDGINLGGKEQVVDILADAVRPGDWILVKGSRGMGMETIVAALVRTGGGMTERPER